jgi:hypothetical protein
MSRAAVLIESLVDLDNRMKGIVEDTTHNHPDAHDMDVPSEYRGQVQVTNVKDDEAKNYWGTGLEFYVDVARGETDLMTPDGEAASISDVSRWFDLKTIDHSAGTVGGSSS